MISTKKTIDIHEAIEPMEAVMALVVYNAGNDVYIEQTDIKDGIPGESKPLSVETTKSIFSNLLASESGTIQAKELLPKNLLYLDINVGNFTVIWYRKSEIRTLKFAKELKMHDYTIKVPAMIYKATRKELSVWAIKDTKVPREKTQLFEAPFPNIYGDARVCLGNTKINIPMITTVQQIIAEYEKSFWYSEFTDNNNYIQYWRKIVKSKKIHTHWNNEDLIPTLGHKKYLTLKDII